MEWIIRLGTLFINLLRKITELDFKTHPASIIQQRSHTGLNIFACAMQAKVYFDNGYGASVITGQDFYTDSDHPYELAVIDHVGNIKYDTTIRGTAPELAL